MASSWLSGNKSMKRITLGVSLSLGLLSGCVSLQAIKSPEESFGVAATDRTLAQRILDKSIENTAKINISRISPTFSETSRVSVHSFYSTVLITGEVPDEEAKKQVEAIVSSMPDIKQLHNKLTVANIKGASYTVHDTYISSKVNAKILTNNAIKSSQVKVVTDDGIVYVMGKLTPAQREHLIAIINSTVGIKELVLLTDLIDSNGAVIEEEAIIQETNLEPPAPRYIEEPVQGVSVVDQSYASQQGAVNDYQPPAAANSDVTNNDVNDQSSSATPAQNSANIYPSPYED